MPDRVSLGSSPVTVRRVALGAGDGQVTVLGQTFVPTWDVGGRQGFVAGSVEQRLHEQGTASLRLANGAGSDGRRHVDRLRCLTDATYAPGDEWFEVYDGGTLIGVWTPTSGSVDRGTITLAGEDATSLLKRTREGQFGYWRHAPRDVIEHYGRVWRAMIAEGFEASGPTFSYGSSSSSDGTWGTFHCESDQTNRPGTMRLRAPGGDIASLISTGSVGTLGGSAADPHMPWRFDITFTRSGLPMAEVGIGLYRSGFTGPGYLYASSDFSANAIAMAGGFQFDAGRNVAAPAPTTVSIEHHAGWVYLTVNGKVAAIMALDPAGNANYYLGIRLDNSSAPGPDVTVDVQSISFRRADRLLVNNRAGDYRLPGAPTPGGLLGEYLPAQDLVAAYGATMASTVMLNPTRDPAATRLEPGVNYPSANPPAWRPNGVPQDYFAARFTGSVYLDLDTADYAVRVTCDDEATVWVGRTRGGEHAAYATGAPGVGASSWLKAGSSSASAPSGATGPLAGMRSGWYPIVVEYKQITGSAGIILEWESSAAVGTWTVIPPAKLSPYGVHRALVRNESHLDALKAVADTYGYQWTTDPRSLGSGEFPGRITPSVRVGRDTERQLGETEATDLSRQVSLDQRADALQADAAGIADPDGAAQLTAEALNLPAMLNHMTIGQDYESLADISEQALLEQRLATLLALRASPWEEVGARPPGGREYLDAWPLTGSLAEFAWGPGDGIRLNLPSVGVVDTAPRQILGLAREFTPTGLRPPTASFRPRPRSLVAALRDLRRTALGPQRNYQQQLAVTTGSLGSSIAAAAPDAYSRLYIPNLDQLANGRLEVVNKSDQSAWDLEVNGTVRLSVTRPGSYDITAWLTPGYNYARLVASGGSTGSFTVRLNLTVRV